MVAPCIADTNTVDLDVDVDGDLTADVRISATSPGLAAAADGLYVNAVTNAGLVRTASGLMVRKGSAHNGWTPGANDIQNPGTTLGPSGYAQVGSQMSLNLQRQGAYPQNVTVTAGAEMLMNLGDFTTENLFYGWGCALEISTSLSPTWVEIAAEGATGPQQAIYHGLHGTAWYTLTTDAVFTVSMRLTMRGGIAGFAICSQTRKRWLHAEYH